MSFIDGPHAYPFPDLEYYFLYPQLAGILLVLDDIHIRSIYNLFEFLRCDEMFRLDEVVRTTAFFTRTDAPVFSPVGDDWSQQRYNTRTLFRYDWRSRLAGALPRSALRKLTAFRYRAMHGFSTCSVQILSPEARAVVSEQGIVEGKASILPADDHLWIWVHRNDVDGWWPQGEGATPVISGSWKVPVRYGGPNDEGHLFEIAAVVVSPTVHDRWIEWVETVHRTGLFPPVQLPPAATVKAEAYRTVQRTTSTKPVES